jgi:hypothetical protein
MLKQIHSNQKYLRVYSVALLVSTAVFLSAPVFADVGRNGRGNGDFGFRNSEALLNQARSELENRDLPKLSRRFWKSLNVDPAVIEKAVKTLEEQPNNDVKGTNSSGFTQSAQFGADPKQGALIAYRGFYVAYMAVSPDLESAYLTGLKQEMIEESLHLIYGNGRGDLTESLALKIMAEINSK